MSHRKNVPSISGAGRFERLGTPTACGVNGRVRAVKVLGAGVYVGGDFTHAGGISSRHMALYTGIEKKADVAMSLRPMAAPGSRPDNRRKWLSLPMMGFGVDSPTNRADGRWLGNP